MKPLFLAARMTTSTSVHFFLATTVLAVSAQNQPQNQQDAHPCIDQSDPRSEECQQSCEGWCNHWTCDKPQCAGCADAQNGIVPCFKWPPPSSPPPTSPDPSPPLPLPPPPSPGAPLPPSPPCPTPPPDPPNLEALRLDENGIPIGGLFDPVRPPPSPWPLPPSPSPLSPSMSPPALVSPTPSNIGTVQAALVAGVAAIGVVGMYVRRGAALDSTVPAPPEEKSASAISRARALLPAHPGAGREALDGRDEDERSGLCSGAPGDHPSRGTVWDDSKSTLAI